jgi:predicted dehydrogenase
VRLDEVAGLDLRPPPLTMPIPTRHRIGMVGFGRIVHGSILPAYRSAGLSVVAAADPDPAARECARSVWGIEHVFADYREMLDAVPLDVVDVNIRWDVGLSPTRVEAVERAAARGIHVLIAKPLAETWPQCRAIVQAARAGGVRLAVNQNSRYAPAFHGCRQLVRAGALGPLISATINYHSALGRQHTLEFDAVHDVSVHAVDVLLSWFETTPVQVFAHRSRRVEDIGSVLAATFVFADGANATLLYDFATRHRRSWEFVAVGEVASADGYQDVELPGPSRLLRSTLRYGPHATRGLALELPLPYTYSPEAFLATMVDLLQSVESGREPWASGADNLRTMATLFALERSIREGVPVPVESDPVAVGEPG